jgi:hypothetical protein
MAKSAGYETLVQPSSEPYRSRRFETARIVELSNEDAVPVLNQVPVTIRNLITSPM